MPEISIIVCSFNHGKWIERCLRSILSVNIAKIAKIAPSTFLVFYGSNSCHSMAGKRYRFFYLVGGGAEKGQ